MVDNPLLSVVIPVYNAEKYLTRCLNSVLNQEYKNIEVLCINDGSTDSSLNILNMYAENDNRVIVIDQINSGAAISRNNAIKIAKGDFITFVDSDDEIKYNIYSKTIPYMKNNDIVCFGTEEHIGDSIDSDVKDSSYFCIESNKKITIDDNFIYKISKTVWNKIFNRSIIVKNDILFPETRSFEDNGFVIKYLLNSNNAYLLKDKLYIYYKICNSIMDKARNYKKSNGKDLINMIDDLFNYINNKGIYQEKCQIFEYFAYRFYKSAIQFSHLYEQAEITGRLITVLQKIEYPIQNKFLSDLKEGNYIIKTENTSTNSILFFKEFNFLEKIFFVGNINGYKCICLFTIPILKIKK